MTVALALLAGAPLLSLLHLARSTFADAGIGLPGFAGLARAALAGLLLLAAAAVFAAWGALAAGVLLALLLLALLLLAAIGLAFGLAAALLAGPLLAGLALLLLLLLLLLTLLLTLLLLALVVAIAARVLVALVHHWILLFNVGGIECAAAAESESRGRKKFLRRAGAVALSDGPGFAVVWRPFA